jgi:hypothetical protein
MLVTVLESDLRSYGVGPKKWRHTQFTVVCRGTRQQHLLSASLVCCLRNLQKEGARMRDDFLPCRPFCP